MQSKHTHQSMCKSLIMLGREAWGMWTMKIKEPKQHKNKQNQERKTKRAIYKKKLWLLKIICTLLIMPLWIVYIRKNCAPTPNYRKKNCDNWFDLHCTIIRNIIDC